MPLIAHAVLAWVAGLWLGFAQAVWLAGTAAVALLLLSWLRDDARLAALAGLGLAAALTGSASRAGERRCQARGAARTRFTATLEQAAAPGAFVPATLVWPGCSVRASLAVAAGSAGAGAIATVTGSASASRRGLLVRRARLEAPTARALLPALRAAAGARVDSAFGRDAPLVRALLIADARSIDPAVRDRFAAAGIVHMLSISGLHVAIIAAAIEVLFVALRLRRNVALAATIAVVAGYVALIGFPPPAVRSAVMCGVAVASRIGQRPVSAWGALALGAATPLLQPRTVLDLGWQLSVLGMASLIASGALVRRWITPRLDGWRASAATVGLVSVVASTVSAPLVAWHFGRVSVVAPLTNIVATPIIALLQPALFLATLTSFAPPLARFLAGAAHPLLAALDLVAAAGASVPGAVLQVAPALSEAVIAGAATVGLLAACWQHAPWRGLAAALAGVALLCWLPALPHHRGDLELHVIDVGQGDAIALRTPAGRWILVDAGRAWRGGDAGRTTVIPYLRRYGGRVALFVLSHPHADHAGGAPSVLRALHPDAYWDGAYAGTSDPYRESLVAARDNAVRWRRTRPGDSLVVDGVRLRVLAPDSSWMASLDDPNEASVVLQVRYGAVRFLLVGDAERGEEGWLVARDSTALRADVLKVGHHGSRTSSTAMFLRAVEPRLALVSVGAGNTYGHPSPAVLGALARAGAMVLRTDRAGSIVVRTDGARVAVEENGDTWTLSNDSLRR